MTKTLTAVGPFAYLSTDFSGVAAASDQRGATQAQSRIFGDMYRLPGTGLLLEMAHGAGLLPEMGNIKLDSLGLL